jgi:SAM-dependent methyltransferase
MVRFAWRVAGGSGILGTLGASTWLKGMTHMATRGDAPPDGLDGAVAARYGALAAQPGTLSCGGALDLSSPGPGERVIDLGCGRGGDLMRAAGMVGPAGRVTGVDGTPRMVEAARERTAGLPHVSVVEGDLAAVPLPAGCADVVVSNCAINHAPDKAAVYREVARLLAPGGRAVVSDVVSEAPLPEAVRSDPAAWAACYGGAIPEADYLAAVEAAGLREVRVLRRTAPYEKGGVLVHSLTLTARAPSSAPEP